MTPISFELRKYIANDMGICFDTNPVVKDFVNSKFDNRNVPKYEHELTEEQKKEYYWLLSDFINR